ncbi:MAG: hypothetical protein IJY89_05140, partial [Clostridia bacterium]|nr:hypothetical protein [Clostridia bacterium]
AASFFFFEGTLVFFHKTKGNDPAPAADKALGRPPFSLHLLAFYTKFQGCFCAKLQTGSNDAPHVFPFIHFSLDKLPPFKVQYPRDTPQKGAYHETESPR